MLGHFTGPSGMVLKKQIFQTDLDHFSIETNTLLDMWLMIMKHFDEIINITYARIIMSWFMESYYEKNSL